MSIFRVFTHFPEHQGWERHVPASARQAPGRASKSGLWRSRFRAKLESRGGGEAGGGGTQAWCHVLQAPFPPSRPHPAGSAACRGDRTPIPVEQKGKGGGGLNEEALFKNVSPVKGPTPPSSRAGDLPQMRVAREAFPRPLTGGTLTPRLSRAP